MGKYIHFTEEEKEFAVNVDIADFLLRQGERLISSGREKRLASNHSITVKGNKWYDHATCEGGSPISFVKNFYGLNFQDTMCLLLDKKNILYKKDEAEEKRYEDFSLPERSKNMRRVYAYLIQTRGIDQDVLNAFVKEKLIYESCEKGESGEYHNAVFVGNDIANTPRHAHKRSLHTMGKSFKMNVKGSNPNYSFHYIGTGNELYVFEAPIDMLSYISMHKDKWREKSYVALCGVSDQAVRWLLANYSRMQKVYFCLDNDQAGITAAKRMIESLSEKEIACESIIPKGKDFNEDLIAMRRAESEEGIRMAFG